MRRFTLAVEGVLTKIPSREAAGGGLRERARRTILLLIASQLGAAIAAAAVLAGVAGGHAAYSALVGAIIGIAPNYYLAGRMFRYRPGATPAEALRGIYAGELVKLAFTAALFVIAIVLLDVDFLIVVLTYVAMVAVNWLALLVVDLGESPPKATAAQGSQLQERIEEHRISANGSGFSS